ncbi:hypothetical protein UY3_04411 [Chelonia mydas]|uniref:Uncharacterized protein n=1 Tax=Chelonia mydas TaxID=8469 RepID=M7BKH9_CHEMY|nr:hypothetical protein UY3_04411 [Chelonia mydas]
MKVWGPGFNPKQLRESFKDLKKKFNNLKFNYTKKTEKARNLKVLKIQIQQVEVYAEKMQILRKKMDNLEKKVTGCVINHPDGKAGVLLESVNELQKQLSKFGRVVEDYKQNLDLIEHLQQMMEEVLHLGDGEKPETSLREESHCGGEGGFMLQTPEVHCDYLKSDFSSATSILCSQGNERVNQ